MRPGASTTAGPPSSAAFRLSALFLHSEAAGSSPFSVSGLTHAIRARSEPKPHRPPHSTARAWRARASYQSCGLQRCRDDRPGRNRCAGCGRKIRNRKTGSPEGGGDHRIWVQRISGLPLLSVLMRIFRRRVRAFNHRFSKHNGPAARSKWLSWSGRAPRLSACQSEVRRGARSVQHDASTRFLHPGKKRPAGRSSLP